MGGFPYVVEAVGAPQSVTESLRAVAHRGTVLLLGAAGISEVDLTPVWYKEAALVGSIRSHHRCRLRTRASRAAPARHSVDRAPRHPRRRIAAGPDHRDARIRARGLTRSPSEACHRSTQFPRHQGRVPAVAPAKPRQTGSTVVGHPSWTPPAIDSNEHVAAIAVPPNITPDGWRSRVNAPHTTGGLYSRASGRMRLRPMPRGDWDDGYDAKKLVAFPATYSSPDSREHRRPTPDDDCGRAISGRKTRMYIGVGTLVVILIILLIVYLLRRA